MKVFVVTYQGTLYVCECGAGSEDDRKYDLTENWKTEGVFRSRKAAEDFINREVEEEMDEMCGSDISDFDRRWFGCHRDNHYSIEEFEIIG